MLEQISPEEYGEPCSARIAFVDSTVEAIQARLGVTFEFEVGDFGCVQWAAIRLPSGTELALAPCTDGRGTLEIWGPPSADLREIAQELDLRLRSVDARA